jgi:glycosyltransferase involved in cell wall biosynthesis
MSEIHNVHLYITGNTNYLDPDRKKKVPANITLTGFLPDDEYLGLIRSADGVMVLTTRDNTLQLGGCESVAIGQPLITSDWPFLREFFDMGTIYVKNNPVGIFEGIETFVKQYDKLQQEIHQLRINGRQKWENQLSELRRYAENDLRR